jgi:hypothetical protein
MIINILNHFATSQDVTHQGLALVLNLVIPDTQAKISLSDVRQMALTHGIVDTVQAAEKQFRTNPNLQQLCKTILDTLMLEWS